MSSELGAEPDLPLELGEWAQAQAQAEWAMGGGAPPPSPLMCRRLRGLMEEILDEA